MADVDWREELDGWLVEVACDSALAMIHLLGAEDQ